MIITFFFSIPLVNFLAPVIATGLLVHVFENLRRDGGGAVPGAT